MARTGSSLLADIRRREVDKVAAVYLVVAWGFIEVADTLLARFLSEQLIDLLLVFAVLGFPVVMTLAWFFDVTEAGITLTRAPDDPANLRRLILFGILVLGITGLLTWLVRPLLDRLEPEARPAAPARDVGSLDPLRVAVLPFDAVGETESYFGEGFAETILNSLLSVGELTVLAKGSSFAAARASEDPAVIADRLRAGTLLEGSVQRAGGKIRVVARLVDARDQSLLWSQTFDRPLSDLFAVQDEIAQAVVTGLETRVASDPSPIERTDPEVYDLVMRGWQLAEGRTLESLARGEALIREALARDPENSTAWTALAQTLGWTHHMVGRDRQRLREDANAAAERAIELDPRNGRAWGTLVAQRREAEDWAGMERAFEQATRYAPNYALTYHVYASSLVYLDRFDEAFPYYEKSLSLDRLDPQVRANLIWTFIQTGRHAEARELMRETLVLFPEDGRVRNIVGLSSVLLGDTGRGVVLLEQGLRQAPDDLLGRSALILGYVLLGDLPSASTHLKTMRDAEPDSALTQMSEFIVAAQVDSKAVIARLEPLVEAGRADATTRRLYGGLLAREEQYALATDMLAPLGQQEPIVFERYIKGFNLGGLYARGWRAMAMIRAGHPDADRALDALRDQLGRERGGGRDDDHLAYWTAQLHALEGDADKVLSALERAVQRGFRSLHVLRRDPVFAPVRDAPRFVELTRALEELLETEREIVGQSAETKT
ncbi:MAG: hypothetical protein R3200_03385 [Xanthomonadales bacterium]|nr:hypothetical protein [Xanthomonadales bacterium]